MHRWEGQLASKTASAGELEEGELRNGAKRVRTEKENELILSKVEKH